MAIVFQCQCGRPLRANQEAAGKRTKCPGCGQILTIPGGVKLVTESQTTSGLPLEGDDPFAPALDWSTLESPKTTSSDSDKSQPAIKIDAGQADLAKDEELPLPEDGTRQYRVLSQKDQGFSGKFNAAKLEEALNSYAKRGWCLKTALAIDVPGHGGHHDELVVILER